MRWTMSMKAGKVRLHRRKPDVAAYQPIEVPGPRGPEGPHALRDHGENHYNLLYREVQSGR